ncbi:hypothetical protein BHM03_00004889 [Ensete ventricosum]|uniref:Uncharacterized protein n=1 Tax=Ensete ventricosum TaxID=4639 RepID=A0A445MAZ6_ENSVE|nr:hypothetical protein BHM03_00004889 [Ensete ventricosum]
MLFDDCIHLVIFLFFQIARPYVLSKLNDYAKFQAVAIAIERSGFKVKRHFDTFCVTFTHRIWIVLLLRLTPLLPFNMLNYLLSVTPIGIGEYMMASCLGMMVLIISGLVISAILMTCVTRVAKTSLEKALAENNVQVDALTAAPSPVSAGATGDLLEPLVVKIDPYRQ